MKPKDNLTDDLPIYIVALICVPFVWAYKKIQYYGSERKRLLKKIEYLEQRNDGLMIERNEFRSQARCYEFYQSENEYLRRKLSSMGVSAKQLKLKRNVK